MYKQILRTKEESKLIVWEKYKNRNQYNFIQLQNGCPEVVWL